jgi:hypothetical protein
VHGSPAAFLAENPDFSQDGAWNPWTAPRFPSTAAFLRFPPPVQEKLALVSVKIAASFFADRRSS